MVCAHPRPVFLRTFATLLGASLAPLLLLVMLAPLSAQDASISSVPVFVSDFELFSAAGVEPATPRASVPSNKSVPNDGPPTVFDASDNPSVQARRLTDFFAITLLQSLQKAGYKVTRSQGGIAPASGVLFRGVFAEADAQNRIRRALFGAGSPGPTMFLYIGTFNLARPDQPLYQPATEQSSDPHYGPIITINNYIPLVKFEVSKNPAKDDVRKICDQIVRNLGSLLKSNPTAFTE